ncbi:assimilatory sulfite reductase (NADPH) hemoprotein subunit [Thiohalorhabdus methylotrophus]|uniref:Sulfite reductase [NADPH] hemoprotein beta-component n=1 Tax=Thiohalorhabdus methylotrophus TaxID=3242694 RepID=A0ABV4TUC3_9GAMM
MRDEKPSTEGLHPNERLKADSDYLRGTIEQGLADPITGAIAESDTQLLKFHGSYMQDDRDLRDERRRQKLEPAYSFMIRVRMPGGVCTPEQWLALDRLASQYANGTLRLTTRQTFQFHGILKGDLKPTIQGINASLLDTIAACGDVNRNVMCHPNPDRSEIHRQTYDWARRISEHLLPNTRAYHEIWLDGERVAGTPGTDSEPLYGPTYLPRKFKIAMAVPPSNDVDVYAHDLGFIAIVEDGELRGFNVTVGGGMGMTHGEPATFPRLADVLGFCAPERAVEVAEQVLAVQRDNGDRVDRKHARLKYTIEDMGPAAFREAVEARLGWALEQARPFHFEDNDDRYGWHQGEDGNWHATLFIENGRIKDSADYPLMTGLREVARNLSGEIRLTPNQNVILSNIPDAERPLVEDLLREHGLDRALGGHSGMRLGSMACVAFPTCGLAMAESERYLPELIGALEATLEEVGLREDTIRVRMTGCPNGCARPYLGEIGLVGKALGRYNLYLGAGYAGQRLNRLYRENITTDQILEEVPPIIRHYAEEREPGEPFGDFVIRKEYVREVKAGRAFHD